MKMNSVKYKSRISISLMVLLMLVCSSVFSRENIGNPQKLTNTDKVLSGCSAGSAYTELKLNNVRTRILTCGDMWWDLNSNPKYEVPKGSGSYASFAGSLWFGGYVGTDLRVSAMTYRQSGVDFWPGPLDPATRDVDPATCVAYDKHWRFNRAEADEFYIKYALPKKSGTDVDPNYVVPSWIKDYPGSAPSQLDRNPGSLYAYLAPFEDIGGDNVYNWEEGDYPRYNVSNQQMEQGQCKRLLFGDETLFWVFNDKGNTHLESGSPNKIGVEIRAQAFEFATGDALNDMTFYNFEIINRSTDILDSTYFAVWVDADLGYYNDDYIGCDVGRGLGYIYNGDNYDQDGQGVVGYKNKLPALGCDFFQGPIADTDDNIDNDKDGCVDCTWPIDKNTGLKDTTLAPIPEDSIPETISMSKFMYYNNDFSNIGNPSALKHYYNYMTGSWKNDTRVRYDNAVGTSTVTTYPICDYVFPGKSDPYGYGVGGSASQPVVMPEWTEKTANNSVGDRRFLQSAGKFTLQPGAINTITFGMPFVRTNSDDNFSAIPLLTIADDKAQSLFDNCFKVLDGPDAPDLTIQEMENQFIVYLSNKETSNNYEQDRYADIDPTITPIFGAATDRAYRFEGYLVYQLKDETVSASDLYDQNKARLVFQSDKRNDAGLLVNYTLDPTLGLVPKLMNERAENTGIKNSFVLTEDLFAEGVKKLVNHKTYYFMAIAYAYNNYLTYKQDVAPGIDTLTGGESHPSSGDYAGQKKPFLQGRRNIKVYSAVPHNISMEANGTVINSNYGFSPKVKRIEGQGNGGNAIDLTDATINSILSSPDHRAEILEYENGRAPIQVKVVDPLRLMEGDFVVKLRKVIPTVDNTQDSLVVGETTDLDSGKVKMSYKFQVSGTYTDFSGQSITRTWDGDEVVGLGQEFLLIGEGNIPLGISVAVSQTKDPNCNIYTDKTTTNTQPNIGSAEEGELLESSMTFANSSLRWLSAVADVDGETEFNWIRSGTVTSGASNPYNDANVPGSDGKSVFDDPNQIYEGVVNGTWAPFRLAAAANLGLASTASPAPLTYAPSIGYFAGPQLQWRRLLNYELDNRSTSSVDIVFTSDKSKWTRSVVLEMGYYNANNIGSARKFLPRKQKSVDQNGVAGDSVVSTNMYDADYISPYGMGWFPGYAINVETGERLNIAFGENSSDSTNNGRDMIWNPTDDEDAFGGMHYIYVFGHNSDGVSGTDPIDVPRYDAGEALMKMLSKTVTANTNSYTVGYGQPTIVEAYKDAMWVNLPLTESGYVPSSGQQVSIPCDAKVKIRVRKPLRYGLSGTWAPSYSIKETQTGSAPSTFVPGTTFLNSINPANLTVDTVAVAQNNNFPMYSFNTFGLGATFNKTDVAKSALDLINVVPNPYYGHSQYEKQRIDNYMKIVNLPVKCTIKIYSVNGTLLRTLNKDTDATPDVSWDLKNDKNILISSGLYIIHVDAGELGEKVVKWFCVMRPIDLQSY